MLNSRNPYRFARKELDKVALATADFDQMLAVQRTLLCKVLEQIKLQIGKDTLDPASP